MKEIYSREVRENGKLIEGFYMHEPDENSSPELREAIRLRDLANSKFKEPKDE
jgi:hypothetical protein